MQIQWEAWSCTTRGRKRKGYSRLNANTKILSPLVEGVCKKNIGGIIHNHCLEMRWLHEVVVQRSSFQMMDSVLASYPLHKASKFHEIKHYSWTRWIVGVVHKVGPSPSLYQPFLWLPQDKASNCHDLKIGCLHKVDNLLHIMCS